jgi:predicted DNA-binding transcriptional regulator AlpA
MRIDGEQQSLAGTERLPDQLISVADIRVLFGLGRTAAYELTYRPGFPEPVVISSRCHRWWASEVMAFANAIRRESPGPRRHGNANHPIRGQIANPGTTRYRITGRVRVARPRRTRS